ncbi:DoxX family protein [Ekhidna sp.]|uniref:DoxX family protein n=1 Tax=Ekhidna sp. TaxID=2608089 RepID=UPI003C79B168
MMKSIRILVIVMRIAFGGLFIYAGVQKFIPKERPKTEASAEVPDNVKKIRSYIGGMKQTGYFWPMLGVVEILGGLLIATQLYSLLGAFILLPVTLNIFLFHIFLTPDDVGENALTALYLMANISLIAYHYQPLKTVFLKPKV